MRLLDDRASARPESRHLVTTEGSALAHDSTLESAGIPDGAVLRLVRLEDAPAAPVVHDVTDEVADELNVRAWRWSPASRRIVSGVATVGWAVLAAALARSEFALPVVGSTLVTVAAVSALAGALFGRSGQRGLATTLLVTGGTVGALGVWTLADAHAWSGAARLAGVAVALVVTLLLLGWFTALGRGGLVGAATVVGCVLCWEVAVAVQSGAGTSVEQAHVGAVLSVVSVVALGVLPRLALTASGLSGLDDRRSSGASVSRYQVSTALTATHRGLALATLVLAASAMAAGLLVLRAPSAWTVLLAVVVTVVLALRARAFPLVTEVVALFGAGAVVAVRLVGVWQEHSGAVGSLVLLVTLAVLPLMVLAVQPAEHVRVRLRRFGDVLESVGVIALFPLVIGAFGVYERLLGTFA
jgi:type VII secretion integral membrane protein EccD